MDLMRSNSVGRIEHWRGFSIQEEKEAAEKNSTNVIAQHETTEVILILLSSMKGIT